MGVSALLIGLIFKLQESALILSLISNWVMAATYWALLALLLSLALNKFVKVKKTDDINKY